MKFLSSLILTMGLLATAPGVMATDTVTVQLANEKSGANANVKVPTDGSKIPVQALWDKTPVSENGIVSASSAQLTKFEQSTECKIVQRHPSVEASLDAKQTWTWLAGGKVVELGRAFISCH